MLSLSSESASVPLPYPGFHPLPPRTVLSATTMVVGHRLCETSLVACYVAPWQLPRLDSHQLADDSFRTHHTRVRRKGMCNSPVDPRNQTRWARFFPETRGYVPNLGTTIQHFQEYPMHRPSTYYTTQRVPITQPLYKNLRRNP